MSTKPTLAELKVQSLKPYDPSTIFAPTPKSQEDLLNHLTAYFNSCRDHSKLPTMTGIARSLNVTRHQLLSTNHQDPVFAQILQHAKQTIVEYVEELLLSGRPPIGLIFWLKNNDNWIDKTEVAHNDKSMSEILQDLEKNGQILNANNPLNGLNQTND